MFLPARRALIVGAALLSSAAPAAVAVPAAAAARAATAPVRALSVPAALSVPQVLGSSFPSELIAAPDGNAVAWVLDERGARNVWVAEAPEFAGRRLTHYSRDDGQVITDLQFAAGGRALAYVRGGSPNRRGELPNPISIATGVKREIFVAYLGGGDPVRLAEGASPVVSPAGDGLVYQRNGALRYAEIPAGPTDEEIQTRLVAKPRGGTGGVRFSPDGTRLLFVSNRSTHSFIGVVGLDGGEVTWLDPSVDSDRFAVWSPDGQRIAFVRVPARRQLVIFSPDREARPFSIRVADVGAAAGASSQVVFAAESGPGSVFRGIGVRAAPNASRGLIWASGDRIVFPWERNGWMGLYSIPAAGGDPMPLAVGHFEVEEATPGTDGSELLVTSNQDDIDRRHVWRVPADGSAPAERIAGGDWIQWAGAPLGQEAVAYLRSSGTVPAHAVIQPAHGAPRALASEAIPADYPSARMVQPQQVILSAADGMRIHGQLFLPAGAQSGERHSAVIFFHGGSRRQMLLGFHYIGYYHNAYAMNQALASRGYVVLALNYRSGIGYGLNFREALHYGARGASEFNDVLGAGLYLRSRDDVDPDRIGLWGGSYGGFLTALGLARASDLFAAGVDLHGVHDWNEGIRIFVPSYDPDEETERLAFESSPNAYLDTWRSPVLLIHGDDDRNVFFSQTVYLVEQLRDRDVPVEQLVFPDEVHGFLLHRSWVRAYEAALEFFGRKLGAGR